MRLAAIKSAAACAAVASLELFDGQMPLKLLLSAAVLAQGEIQGTKDKI